LIKASFEDTFLEASITLAPSFTKESAASFPIPELLPLIKTILFFNKYFF